MRLSKRLEAIACVVKDCETVADIGCDHAQLSVALIEKNKCNHVFASDLRYGPIVRARQTVQDNDMSDYITCIHGDGLEKIDCVVDCIVIAGMGFETIQHILKQGESKAHLAKQIVLASHTQVNVLREWLYTQGYRIDNECIVYDKFYYEILSVRYAPEIEYCNFDYEIGEFAHKDLLFIQMLEHKLEVLEAIIKKIPQDSDKLIELKDLREKYLHYIEKAK